MKAKREVWRGKGNGKGKKRGWEKKKVKKRETERERDKGAMKGERNINKNGIMNAAWHQNHKVAFGDPIQ